MSFQTVDEIIQHYRKESPMSKVTEELDFMWEKRVFDFYESYSFLAENEKYIGPNTIAMAIIKAVLKLQGLTVKGIEG